MNSPHDVARARTEGVLFGIPLGDLGWFSSLLMGFATGFAAFFLTTFLSIMALLFYRISSGRNPDFAIASRSRTVPVTEAANSSPSVPLTAGQIMACLGGICHVG